MQFCVNMYDNGMIFCYHQALKAKARLKREIKYFTNLGVQSRNIKMKEVINNNSKYKLKYWFAMLYIHGRKFMIGSVFL